MIFPGGVGLWWTKRDFPCSHLTLRLNNQEVAKNSSGVLLKVLKVAHKFFLMT